MNGELAVHKILSSTSGYYNLVGGSEALARVFYDEADQTQVLDFCIIHADDIEPTDDKDGGSQLDFDFIYVTHFAVTKTRVSALASAARAALDRASGTKNNIVVSSIQFITQRSDSERLVDKRVHTVEQLYKVITQQ